jgi:hypothetical protein
MASLRKDQTEQTTQSQRETQQPYHQDRADGFDDFVKDRPKEVGVGGEGAVGDNPSSITFHRYAGPRNSNSTAVPNPNNDTYSSVTQLNPLSNSDHIHPSTAADCIAIDQNTNHVVAHTLVTLPNSSPSTFPVPSDTNKPSSSDVTLHSTFGPFYNSMTFSATDQQTSQFTIFNSHSYKYQNKPYISADGLNLNFDQGVSLDDIREKRKLQRLKSRSDGHDTHQQSTKDRNNSSRSRTNFSLFQILSDSVNKYLASTDRKINLIIFDFISDLLFCILYLVDIETARIRANSPEIVGLTPVWLWVYRRWIVFLFGLILAVFGIVRWFLSLAISDRKLKFFFSYETALGLITYVPFVVAVFVNIIILSTLY